MPPWITDAVLVALITGVLGVIGGRVSARGQAEAAQIQGRMRTRELAMAPYEALAARVTQLENEAVTQRETIDSQQTEIAGLRVEMEGLRAARAADVRAWSARDACWQEAWDDLRDNWGARRAAEYPPPYPVERFDNSDYISGGDVR